MRRWVLDGSVMRRLLTLFYNGLSYIINIDGYNMFEVNQIIMFIFYTDDRNLCIKLFV